MTSRRPLGFMKKATKKTISLMTILVEERRYRVDNICSSPQTDDTQSEQPLRSICTSCCLGSEEQFISFRIKTNVQYHTSWRRHLMVIQRVLLVRVLLAEGKMVNGMCEVED